MSAQESKNTISHPELRQCATNISKAFWCRMAGGLPAYEEAKFAESSTSQGVSWFDTLFRGGLKLPTMGRPLTMLITGPPGTGKTTLAMEICCGLTMENFSSYYLSTDQDTGLLVQHATSLLGPSSLVKPWVLDQEANTPGPVVLVSGRDLLGTVPLIDQLKDGATKVAFPLAEIAMYLAAGIHVLMPRSHDSRKMGPTPQVVHGRKKSADLFVIDGLNSVDPADQPAQLEQFLQLGKEGVKLLIFILDSGDAAAGHRPWEYACDIVIKMDEVLRADIYRTHSLTISKSRYQEHVLGDHQYKIYPPSELPEVVVKAKDYADKCANQLVDYPKQRALQEKATSASLELESAVAAMRRGHPYRNQGGIFVYPSIHYYLSRYKHGGHRGAAEYDSTMPELLSRWLHDESDRSGLPQGRCSAFIGTRGGHKSHLAYLHVLHRMLNHHEKALVLSLRDDEGMTRQAMSNIMAEEGLGDAAFERGPGARLEAAVEHLKRLEETDMFEILYFHPGCITPEEFFHRMFVSLQRLKQSRHRLTVMFNSVDQLASRFPLCAREELFIPGIIETLTGEGATSIVIAVDEKGQPPEQYGLLPMADLIIDFQPEVFEKEEYYRLLIGGKTAKKGVTVPEGVKGKQHREEIVLKVVRFAGGQRAGARGILELAPTTEVYRNKGLNFTPLPDFVPRSRLNQADASL